MDLNGKELIVQPSSFRNVMDLKRVISKALRADGITLDLKEITIDEKDFKKSDIGKETLGSLIENLLAIVTDENVENALFKCCEKVVMLDKELIDLSFFEKVENRQYYYPIMLEVLKVNLMPFFEKISSMFSGVGELMQKFQK